MEYLPNGEETEWQFLTPMGIPRTSLTAATIEGSSTVFAIGGQVRPLPPCSVCFDAGYHPAMLTELTFPGRGSDLPGAPLPGREAGVLVSGGARHGCRALDAGAGHVL